MKNPFGSFFEDAASAAKDLADNAAKAASDAAANVASTVGPAVNEAAKAVSDTAAKAAEAAAPVVGEAAKVASETASNVAGAVTQKAQEAASAVVETAEKGAAFIAENSPSARLKRERLSGFRDGINQGAYLAGQARYNFYYAYVATLCFFLRSDNDFSEEERSWLEDGLSHLKLEGGLPDEVKTRLYSIADNESLTFEEVSKYLDDISLASLDSIVNSVTPAIELDGVVTEEEEHARQTLLEYADARISNVCDRSNDWGTKAVENSVAEYSENYDRINEEFKEKAKLQDKDLAFLMGATMLQVTRVLVINALTEIENAGVGNAKENALHGAQEKLFNQIERNERVNSDRLYASTHHILSTKGVPYDATNTGGKLQGLFKGANHRFSTLGHDPVLGLIFGTSNIMTNTITCVNNAGLFGTGFGIPATYTVDYASGSPIISASAGNIEMLIKSAQRVGNEPEAAAAALIKQIVHIGTDLYTPCGIQLPLANIVLDKAHADKLSKYVSTGDVLKVGAQAGMTLLINWLIASLHGSSLIFQDDGSDFAFETYQIRTKKILLISDTIATSSSVIQAAVTNNPKCLDIGGAAVLVYRLFTDGKFIAKVKEDYINTGLNDIYEKRAEGILF